MKPKFILMLLLFSFGPMGAVSADYSSGLNAYKKENYLKALVEWLPLAEQGVSQAQYNLAGMYTKGYGVKIDDAKAVYWYNKAAEQGHSRSQYNLGVMYLSGTGTQKSIEDAKYWLHLAYDSGTDEAEKIWNQNKLWKY
jgi:TPR repeat protein|tara:strand:- start:31 stop:447 length:417 start_codon:yes stop_codon:yes gene_type:complete